MFWYVTSMSYAYIQNIRIQNDRSIVIATSTSAKRQEDIHGIRLLWQLLSWWRLETPFAAPKRGGIHPAVSGLYIGGCALHYTYKPTKDLRLTYHFSSQRRNVKTISSIEGALVKACDTITKQPDVWWVPWSHCRISDWDWQRVFIALLDCKVEEHVRRHSITFKIHNFNSKWNCTPSIILRATSVALAYLVPSTMSKPPPVINNDPELAKDNNGWCNRWYVWDDSTDWI